MRRALLLVAPLALAACTPDAMPRTEQPIAAGPSVVAVLECGTFTLMLSDDFPADGSRCLIDATKARQPARLQVTRPTDEGDPIVSTYTSDATGRVTLVLDTRQDNFGPKEVTRQTCDAPTAIKDWIELSGCSQPTPVS